MGAPRGEEYKPHEYNAEISRGFHGARPERRLRDQFEAMQNPYPGRPLPLGRAVSEEHQKQSRRQREACPRGQAAEIPCAHEADGEPDLAARRARQELAQCHQIRIGGFIEPAAADHDVASAKRVTTLRLLLKTNDKATAEVVDALTQPFYFYRNSL